MSDEALRQAYARAVASRTPADRLGCPGPDAILALVSREGADDERLSVLDHVMACPACLREFEMLRSIERGGRKAVAAEADSSPTTNYESPAGRVVGHIAWRRWAPLAAAAAILLVVALGPGRSLWERRPETVRGGHEALALIAPDEGMRTSGATVTFAWHSAPGSERYTLELLTSGGAVALSRTTATSDTTLTLTLPPTLAPGDYRWWVTATSGDGSVTRSVTRALRLGRR